MSCYKTDVVQYQTWNLDPVTKVSGMQVNHVPRQYTVFYGNRFLSKHDETIWADTENYYSDFSDIKFERMAQYLYHSLTLIMTFHIVKDGKKRKIFMME